MQTLNALHAWNAYIATRASRAVSELACTPLDDRKPIPPDGTRHGRARHFSSPATRFVVATARLPGHGVAEAGVLAAFQAARPQSVIYGTPLASESRVGRTEPGTVRTTLQRRRIEDEPLLRPQCVRD